MQLDIKVFDGRKLTGTNVEVGTIESLVDSIFERYLSIVVATLYWYGPNGVSLHEGTLETLSRASLIDLLTTYRQVSVHWYSGKKPLDPFDPFLDATRSFGRMFILSEPNAGATE